MNLSTVNLMSAPALHAAPWGRVLASQAGGLGIATLGAALCPVLFGQEVGTVAWLTVQCLSATAIASVCALAWWWRVCCLIFVPALFFGLSLQVSSMWPALALLILLLAYGGTQSTQVPLYLSSVAAISALRKLIPTERPQRILDLGCGTGKVLDALRRSHALATLEGVERAPLPFILAWCRGFLRARRFRVLWQSLWKANLGGFDLVYAYLSPVPMAKLWEKAVHEMHPGAWLVSFRFAVPGVAPCKVMDADGHPLYVYQIP
ncbi:MAG: class I SAM-dependent methyltransferase [Burkholderiales bacterium]